MMKPIQILIVDLGSQYSLIIRRTLQELGFRSVVLSPEHSEKWLQKNTPKAIILSGGSASVYDKNAPVPPDAIFKNDVPILGICYGMQWLVKYFGGEVTPYRDKKEYGEAYVSFNYTSPLFMDVKDVQGSSIVWASHGDSIESLPSVFDKIGESRNDSKIITAIAHKAKPIYGVQFHPEVTHTRAGRTILFNFIRTISRCERNCLLRDVVAEIRQELMDEIKSERAIIGFSGGTDSTTLAAIASDVLKDNLLAVCIDTGALRKGELEEIKQNAVLAKVNLKIIKAAGLFQKALGNTIDAETKRRRFKKCYKEIFEKAAREFGAKFILQGTLATDIIESGSVGQSAKIKSHHNVGLVFKGLEQFHPLRNLFKYEVRAIAKELGLPDSISQRQPFPGPGLFVRVIGKPATPKRLAIVREADATAIAIAKKHNHYDKNSQLLVTLICVRSVGVKGDGRTYGYSAIVRGVVTTDFMTASGYQFPDYVRREMSSEITKHPKIVRVFFDETNKPPATTELE